METIRVLIVDDTSRVRQGLRTVLALVARRNELWIEIAGEAQNGYEAIQQARDLHPDVILMDLEMPIMDGYEATRRIKAFQPDVRIVILTIHTGATEKEQAREAGADAFIEKGASYSTLLNAILGGDGTTHSFDFRKGEK